MPKQRITYRSMLLFVLVALLLLVAYEAIQMAARVHTGKTLAAAAVPYKRSAPNGSPRILVAGDSTALGVGTKRPEDSTAGRLGQTYADAEIVTIAKNGTRLRDIPSMLAAVKGQRFSLALLQAGANDIIRFTDLQTVRADLRDALTATKKQSDTVVYLHSGNVGLAPFFPRPIGWIYSARTRAFRAIAQDETQRLGVSYVDLYTERAHDPFAHDAKRFYAPDGLHLSSEGYAIWHERIVETIKRNGIVF